MILLAQQNKGKKSKLLVCDLEKHFELYGIDFYQSDAARKFLVNKLISLGLMQGSPDAGSSAQIRNFYKVKA